MSIKEKKKCHSTELKTADNRKKGIGFLWPTFEFMQILNGYETAHKKSEIVPHFFNEL